MQATPANARHGATPFRCELTAPRSSLLKVAPWLAAMALASIVASSSPTASPSTGYLVATGCILGAGLVGTVALSMRASAALHELEIVGDRLRVVSMGGGSPLLDAPLASLVVEPARKEYGGRTSFTQAVVILEAAGARIRIGDAGFEHRWHGATPSCLAPRFTLPSATWQELVMRLGLAHRLGIATR